MEKEKQMGYYVYRRTANRMDYSLEMFKMSCGNLFVLDVVGERVEERTLGESDDHPHHHKVP